MEKRKNIHIWLYSIMAAALLAVFIWGASATRRANAAAVSVENQYNRAFHELVSYIDDIDTQLTKSQLAASPAQLATIASEIFKESAEAKSCLGQLPTSDVQLDNTAKFLSQVGDYTYVLSQDMINGTEISEEAYNNLATLNRYASDLNKTLKDIEQKLYAGQISLSDLASGSYNTAKAADVNIDVVTNLENVEKSFDDYPSLIYDGPFSEHIENRESVMLKGAPEITRTEAMQKAEEFLGMDGRGLKFQSSAQNTAIGAYNFTNRTDDRDISISVTKNGGYILYFLDNRKNTGEENYDIETATKTAQSFLENHGFGGMVSSYYEKKNNTATINFAYSDNGTICYSDLIKVKVALDTGAIIGIETKGYLMNHTEERNVNPVVLSEDEARAKISDKLNVTATGLAIIPKDSLQEVLCYEFHGTFAEKNFLIYVNAENGREEKIFLLIESEDGILTV